MITVRQLIWMLRECPPDTPVLLHVKGREAQSLVAVYGHARGQEDGEPGADVTILTADETRG